MAEIGEVTPGSPITTRLPRETPVPQPKEQRQEPDGKKENRENEQSESSDNKNQDDGQEGGIDLYV